MGTTNTVCAVCDEVAFVRAVSEVKARIYDFEKRFSRFDRESELSRFNGRKTELFEASVEFISLLKLSLKMMQKTGGLFEPCILDDLERAGYDQSFELIEGNRFRTRKKEFADVKKYSLQQAEINEDSGKVFAPLGLKIDFGGIGKGFALEQAAGIFLNYSRNFWVSFGGDMVFKGKDEQGKNWVVGIEDALNPNRNVISLSVTADSLAVATSGSGRRFGYVNGRLWNHIVDPRTGESSRGDVLSVTVIGRSPVEADVFAKAVFLLGQREGPDFCEKNGCTCIMQTKTGMIIRSKPTDGFEINGQ